MSPAFLEWLYFVAVFAGITAATVLLIVAVAGLVIACAFVLRLIRPRESS